LRNLPATPPTGGMQRRTAKQLYKM
jgi:hypothetical protein